MDIAVEDFAAYFPPSWTKVSAYKDELYKLFDVQSYTEEFTLISEIMGNSTPSKIERIQYPTAFLRYLTHSEFLESNNSSYSEKVSYYKISLDDLDKCLIYYFDERYVNFERFNVNAGHVSDSQVVVMVKERHGPYVTETDKNYLPMYVIYF